MCETERHRPHKAKGCIVFVWREVKIFKSVNAKGAIFAHNKITEIGGVNILFNPLMNYMHTEPPTAN